MSSSKRQSLIMTGIGLILLSALLMYFALSQPKISEEKISTTIAQIKSTTEIPTENNSENQSLSQSASVVTKSTQSQKVTDKTVAVNYPLNLNTCTVDELVTIDGIGEAKADAIIQYREYLGGYTSVEQIKSIKGIGDSIYEKVSPYLTV